MRKTMKTAALAVVMTMIGFVAGAQSFSYTSGFETSADTAGWVLLGGSETNKWAIGTAEHNAGTHGLYVSQDNGATAGYSTSSTSFSYAYYEFTLAQAAALEIGFDWKCYGESSWDYIRVFLVSSTETITPGQTPDGGTNAYSFSTAAAPAGWTDVSNGKLNYQSSWQSVFSTFNVNAGTWRLVFLWCNDASGGNTPAGCIDNVSIVEPTCPRPGNLRFTNITSDSCTLVWHERGQASQWVIEYADSAFLPGCYQGNQVWVYDTIYSLDNLQPNTTYHVYLRSDCGSDTSINISGSFTTRCMPFQRIDLPLTENFDSAAFDNCWDRFYVSNGTVVNDTSKVYFSTSYAASGTRSLYFNGYNSGNPVVVYALLPMMEDSVGELDLFFKMYNSSSASISVVTMADPSDPSTYRTVRTFTTDGSDQWSDCDVSLFNLPQNHRFVAFAAVNTGSSVYTYIDNVILAQRSNCPRPQTIALAGMPTSDSVNVAWYGNDPNVYQWNLALVSPGGNPDTCQNLVTAYDTTYQFQYLAHLTAYDVYVRSDCGSEVSPWRGPLSFTTGVYKMATSGVDTLVACSADIFDNGGPADNYSHGCNATLIVRAPSRDSILYITGTYSTESSWDYINIYDGIGTSGTPLLLNNVSGSGTIGPFLSTGNAVTITFYSDASVSDSGFHINVHCFSIPDCYIPVNLTAAPLADSCTLTWSELGGSTSWTVEYGPHGFVPGNGTSTTVYDTTYVITGLTNSTQYDCYVWANCNSGDNSDTASVTFTTLCNTIAVTSQGYSEGFENVTDSLPVCWSEEANGTNWYVDDMTNYSSYATTTTPHAGSNVMLVEATNGETSRLISPMFDISALTTPTLSFWHMQEEWSSDQDELQVCVRSSTGSRWTVLANYTSSISTWQRDTFSLAGYTMVQVSFLATCNYGYGVVLDDIFIGNNGGTVPTPCDQPTNLLVSNTTSSSVTVSWSGSGNFEVSYKEASTSSWSTPAQTSSTSYTFTGLTTATQYDWRVRKVCSSSNYSTWATSSFTVPCQATVVTAQGYNEGFEGLYDLPTCWTEEAVGTNWYVDDMSFFYSGTESGAHGGSNVAYLEGYNNESSRLLTPMFDISALTSPKLTFWHLQEDWSGYQDELQVCIRANTSSRWAVVATYTNSIAAWRCDTISLAGYTNVQISFLGTGNDGYGVILDDIFIGNITGGGGGNPPTPCDDPTGLATTSTTSSSATVSWTESGSFQVSYKQASSSNWSSPITVNASTYTFTGLAAATQYDWRVCKVCSANDISNWSTSSFTTQQGGQSPCDAPTNLNATGVTSNSAVLSWSGSGNFELSYKMASAADWSNPVSVGTTNYTLNNLVPATAYQWRVRTVCASDNMSQWSTSDFTTERGNGIVSTGADGAQVAIYPNPARTAGGITVEVRGVEGMVNVSLIDVTGRTLRQASQECHKDCTKQIDLAGVARGAYFVKVQTQNGTTVEKLIVK